MTIDTSNKNNNKSGWLIIKQLSMLMKNNIFCAAASYFLTITLARVFGPEWFGEYSYILIWGMIATVVINFETDKTAPFFYSKSKDLSLVVEKILSTRIIFFCLICVISALLAINNIVLSLGIISLALTSLNFSFLYEIKRQNVTYSYIYLAERMIYLTSVFVLLYLEKVDLIVIYSILAISTLISILFQVKQNWSVIRKVSLKSTAALEVLKNNFLLILITFLTYSYGGFSRIILEDKLGTMSLGIFSAGWQLIIIITLFQAQVTRVWRVDISDAIINKDIHNFISKIRSYLQFTTLPIIIFAIVMYLFSNDIVNLIYGSDYDALNQIIPILCLYFIVINFDSLGVMLWIAIGKQKDYFKISLVSAILLITLLVFIPNQTELKTFATCIVATHATSVIVQLIWIYFNYLNDQFWKMKK